MAAKLSFEDKELPVQDVVDILVKEIKKLRGNYTELNETIRLAEQRNVNENTGNTSTDDMNLTLANTMSLTRPNFDLVSVIPTFNGEERENVADFISKIDDVGTLSGWSEEYKIVVAKLKLKGTAFSFSKSDEACQTAKSLKALQNALEGRFKDRLPDHFYFEQLANSRQERGESIEAYSDRIKLLSNKTIRCTHNAEVDRVLREEGDRRAMEAFTRGLFGELGKQVRIRFPKTLQEAVTLAIAMRDVERRPPPETNNISKRVFLTPHKNNQQGIQCENCNRFGHKQSECRDSGNRFVNFNSPPQGKPFNRTFFNFGNSRRDTPNPTKQCNYCRRSGHWESECRTKIRQLSQNRGSQGQSRLSYRDTGNDMERQLGPNPRHYDNNRFVPRRTYEQQHVSQHLRNTSIRTPQPTNHTQIGHQTTSENFPGSSTTATGASRNHN